VRRTPLLVAGLLLIGLNLRTAVASVGPVLSAIQRDTGLGSAGAGVLTALPVLCFGGFAFVVPSFSRWIGLHRLLGAAMVVLTAGVLLRLHPSTLALFVGTVLAGAAIAVGNTTVPAVVKADVSGRTGLVMGAYSMSLSLGAALASGLTVPIATRLDDDWRPALAVWALPAVVALLAWSPQLRRRPVAAPVAARPGPGLLRDRAAVAVTLFMGVQSLGFYATLTWTPSILVDAGLSDDVAGWMLSLSTVAGMLGSLVTPALAERSRPDWLPIAIAVALCGLAYVGLLVAPSSGAAVWMLALGLSQGASLSLALGAIVWLSTDPGHAARVSTLAQGVGYLVAATGPALVGVLYGWSGGWTVPLVVLLALLVPQLGAGVVAITRRSDPV
jgi:CP family cyanate transporter-like MFS transporter